MTTLSIQKKGFDFRKTNNEISILMKLTIYGSIMIQIPIVTQHQNFGRKINRKNSSIQIGVMQDLSRFNSFRTHFRINLVMTDNMSTYEK